MSFDLIVGLFALGFGLLSVLARLTGWDIFPKSKTGAPVAHTPGHVMLYTMLPIIGGALLIALALGWVGG